jgi:hypothetical protein
VKNVYSQTLTSFTHSFHLLVNLSQIKQQEYGQHCSYLFQFGISTNVSGVGGNKEGGRGSHVKKFKNHSLKPKFRHMAHCKAESHPRLPTQISVMRANVLDNLTESSAGKLRPVSHVQPTRPV